MRISDIAAMPELNVLVRCEDSAVSGCYIGDLLSRVISRSVAGGVWITIMNNMNVPAVALLAEIPCIILAEDVAPMEGVCEKCAEEGIWLLQSSKSAYELACILNKANI